jgi:hypothetical protein
LQFFLGFLNKSLDRKEILQLEYILSLQHKFRCDKEEEVKLIFTFFSTKNFHCAAPNPRHISAFDIDSQLTALSLTLFKYMDGGDIRFKLIGKESRYCLCRGETTQTPVSWNQVSPSLWLALFPRRIILLSPGL